MSIRLAALLGWAVGVLALARLLWLCRRRDFDRPEPVDQSDLGALHAFGAAWPEDDHRPAEHAADPDGDLRRGGAL